MSERIAFLRSILASPADDAPRLIYADWLDEHGEGERAEFVRLQCRLHRLIHGEGEQAFLQAHIESLEGRIGRLFHEAEAYGDVNEARQLAGAS